MFYLHTVYRDGSSKTVFFATRPKAELEFDRIRNSGAEYSFMQYGKSGGDIHGRSVQQG
jgi:hypothetical protein